MKRVWEDFAGRLNLRLTPAMELQLENLAGWLNDEAVPAGGLGPGEGQRLGARHLADSLEYTGGWEEPPPDCVDLGSGVGLPGLVLAVVWPSTAITLVDRSTKRCDLARRAARVAGIPVTVVESDVFALEGVFPAIVSRAAIPASKLRPLLNRLLTPGGRAVVSGDGGHVDGYRTLEVLDRPARLLMMQKS